MEDEYIGRIDFEYDDNRLQKINEGVAVIRPVTPLPDFCNKGKRRTPYTMVLHKDIFMPDNAKIFYCMSKFKYGRPHFTDRVHQRDIDVKLLPTSKLDLPDDTVVIEVEYEGIRMSKQVIRGKYDSDFDFVMPVLKDGTVLSVWLNKRSDKHTTLKRQCYHTEQDYVKILFK